jgi:hypothetical protein
MTLAYDHVPGHRGATRASWRDNNPRVLIARIMAEHPQAGVEEICRRVRKALAGADRAFQEAFNDYCTVNHYNVIKREEDEARGLRRPRPGLRVVTSTEATVTSAKRRGDQAAASEAAIREVAPIIESIKKIVLMDLATPFGKLGDCTGAQGRKLTGWMKNAFRGVSDKQKLRDVKTEADLHKLLKL